MIRPTWISETLHTLLYVMCFLFSLNSQEYFNKMKTYGISDGLESPYVISLFKDFDGYLWVGTRDGIHKFDGREFQYLPAMVDSEALKGSFGFIYQTRDSVLWFTGDGLCSLNPRNNSIHCFEYHEGEEDSIGAGNIKGIFEDDTGDLWIASIRNGLMKLDRKKGSFEFYYPETGGMNKLDALNSHHTKRIAQDPDEQDILWITTRNGLQKFDKSTGQFEIFNHGISRRDDQTNLLIDNRGAIWCGSYNGLWKFDVSTNSWTTFELISENGRSLNVVDIDFKSDTELWVSDVDNGPGVFNMESFQFEPLPSNIDISGSNRPSGWGDVFLDNDGILWVASRKGLAKFDPYANQFTNIRVEGPTSMGISQYTSNVVLGPGGSYLFGTDISNSFFEWNGTDLKVGSFTPSQMSSNVRSGTSHISMSSKGHYWIAGGGGVTRLDGQGRALSPQWDPLFFNGQLVGVMDVLEDPQGSLWIGTQRNGIFRVWPENHVLSRYYETSDVPDSTYWKFEYVSDLFEDSDGDIWHTGNYGAHCIDPLTGQTMSVGSWSTRGITETPDGMIWVATHGDGLFAVRKTDQGLIIERNLSTQQNLLSDILHRIVTDQEGRLWFTHTRGISVFDPISGDLRHYGTLDGFPDNINIEGSLDILSDGNIALAYEDRVSIVDPGAILKNPRAPDIFITDLKIFNQSIDRDIDIKYQKQVVLNHNENFITIDFWADNFSIPEKNQFAFRLEGLEEEWRHCTACSSTNYTGLKPGRYQFVVKGSNQDGVWNETGRSLDIRILPPFWQTMWFRILTILSILLLVMVGHRYRIGRIRERADFEKRLNELELVALRSQMNPHFLFNTLNSIKRYIVKNEPVLAAEYLNTFSSLMRQVLNNSGRSQVSLAEECRALELYLELESLRFQHKFDYNIDLDPKIEADSAFVPPMLLQPYVENAIWHGLMHKPVRGRLVIRVKQEERKDERFLVFTIEDNGIGRRRSTELQSKTSLRKKSMGMQVTAHRLEILNKLNKMGARVQIIDLEDEEGTGIGTRVELQLKLEDRDSDHLTEKKST